MKGTSIALAALLLPALALAENPQPYVVYQGRAVRTEQGAPGGAGRPAAAVTYGGAQQANVSAGRTFSAFGTSAFRPGVSSGRSFSHFRPSARAFRGVSSSHSRGFAGSRSVGTPAPGSSVSTPPAYAVPGAKILSEGQQPVYSQAAGGGTHSVEGGGFIAMDQAKAHDVGRAPGITWAPPDTPPSASRNTGSGGSGASANGPAPAGTSGSGGSGNSGNDNGNGNGNGDNGDGVGGNGSGQGNNGNGQLDNSTGFNPAF